MRAVVDVRYGPPEVLHVLDVERPAVNPVDWQTTTGKLYLMRRLGYLGEGHERDKVVVDVP